MSAIYRVNTDLSTRSVHCEPGNGFSYRLLLTFGPSGTLEGIAAPDDNWAVGAFGHNCPTEEWLVGRLGLEPETAKWVSLIAEKEYSDLNAHTAGEWRVG